MHIRPCASTTTTPKTRAYILASQHSVNPFKAYQPDYVHIHYKYLPQIADADRRRYLFVAINRATVWVHVEITADKSTRSATAFLEAVHAKAPFRLRELVTHNDKAFTDRRDHKARQPSGKHVYERVCPEASIERRLAPMRRVQTSGVVERFNGRISEVLTATPLRLSIRSGGQALRDYVNL